VFLCGASAGSSLGTLLCLESSFSFLACANISLRTPSRFGGKRGVGFSALFCEDRQVALGLRARLLGRCRFGLRAFAVAKRFCGTRFVFGALAGGLLRQPVGFGARVGGVRRAFPDVDTLACDDVRLLFRFETRHGDRLGFRLPFGRDVRLRNRLELDGFALFRGFVGLHVGFRAGDRGRFCFSVRLEPGRCALLELDFGPLTRAQCFRRFVFSGGTRLRRFRCARLRSCACSRDSFGGHLSVGSRSGLALELAFGLSAIAFGFERFLICGSPRFRGFGCAGFDRSTRFGRRLGGALGFAARSRLLLYVVLEREPRVSGFDGLLIDGCSRMRRVLGFDLRLLASLCFLDCASVGRNAALRPHFGLPLHFRPL